MVRSKKWPFRAAVGMILTVALVLVPGCGKDGQETSGTAEGSRKAEGDIVLYLDGSPVSAEEYGMLTQKFSSQITMQYTTDQVNQEDFWETETDGETPYSRLADLVEEQLRENYVLKELAVELDLTEDYTYGDLMDSMEQENEERSDLSDDEISYGLSSYDAASYYQYWYSNLETRVTEAVIRQEVQVSEADCREYYEENPQASAYELGVSILYAEIPESDPNAWNTARQLCAALESGASEEEIQEALEVSLKELTLTSYDTQAGMSGVYQNRWEIASGLSAGQVYGPYEDQGAVCVMQCTDRAENGQVAFEEMKSQIERYLQAQKAQEIIKNRTEEMEVESGTVTPKEVIVSLMQG